MPKENTTHKPQAIARTTATRPIYGGIVSGKSMLRVYGKSELAQLYCDRPISDAGARKWFMKELAYVPGLMARLKALGFRPKNKLFSRAQVAAIFEVLGAPIPRE